MARLSVSQVMLRARRARELAEQLRADRRPGVAATKADMALAVALDRAAAKLDSAGSLPADDDRIAAITAAITKATKRISARVCRARQAKQNARTGRPKPNRTSRTIRTMTAEQAYKEGLLLRALMGASEQPEQYETSSAPYGAGAEEVTLRPRREGPDNARKWAKLAAVARLQDLLGRQDQRLLDGLDRSGYGMGRWPMHTEYSQVAHHLRGVVARRASRAIGGSDNDQIGLLQARRWQADYDLAAALLAADGDDLIGRTTRKAGLIKAAEIRAERAARAYARATAWPEQYGPAGLLGIYLAEQAARARQAEQDCREGQTPIPDGYRPMYLLGPMGPSNDPEYYFARARQARADGDDHAAAAWSQVGRDECDWQAWP